MIDDFEDYLRAKRAERSNERADFWKDFAMTGALCTGLGLLIVAATAAAPAIRSFLVG